MSEDTYSQKQKLIRKIQSWTKRADMAKQAGREDLVTKAVDIKRELENQLAKLQEFESKE